jgi:hypothetical protein
LPDANANGDCNRNCDRYSDSSSAHTDGYRDRDRHACAADTDGNGYREWHCYGHRHTWT